MVNRAFHAAFTLPRCFGEIEAVDLALWLRAIKAATITEALKKENVNDNFALRKCFISDLSWPNGALRTLYLFKEHRNWKK
jgi:hypothetical protein